ncbi:hypothetical protein Nepgr_011093 [Nepenthes gracilis]|uniref:Uncharacterized protein n=1 Tax=Nepenthes gracilis TaxID=150966 RepID=A0AAD3XLN1_NEPGR|nr:hypothetical protein Nepgr_011093 [Nepenthes gracilis]
MTADTDVKSEGIKVEIEQKCVLDLSSCEDWPPPTTVGDGGECTGDVEGKEDYVFVNSNHDAASVDPMECDDDWKFDASNSVDISPQKQRGDDAVNGCKELGFENRDGVESESVIRIENGESPIENGDSITTEIELKVYGGTLEKENGENNKSNNVVKVDNGEPMIENDLGSNSKREIEGEGWQSAIEDGGSNYLESDGDIIELYSKVEGKDVKSGIENGGNNNSESNRDSIESKSEVNVGGAKSLFGSDESTKSEDEIEVQGNSSIENDVCDNSLRKGKFNGGELVMDQVGNNSENEAKVKFGNIKVGDIDTIRPDSVEVKDVELDVENGESSGALARVPPTSSLDDDSKQHSSEAAENGDVGIIDEVVEQNETTVLDPEPQAFDDESKERPQLGHDVKRVVLAGELLPPDYDYKEALLLEDEAQSQPFVVCQPLGDDAISQPLEGVVRKFQISDSEVEGEGGKSAVANGGSNNSMSNWNRIESKSEIEVGGAESLIGNNESTKSRGEIKAEGAELAIKTGANDNSTRKGKVNGGELVMEEGGKNNFENKADVKFGYLRVGYIDTIRSDAIEVNDGELDVENGESNGSLARVPQTSSLDNDVTPHSSEAVENDDVERTDVVEEKNGTVFLDPEPQAFDVGPKELQQLEHDVKHQRVKLQARELQPPDCDYNEAHLLDDKAQPQAFEGVSEALQPLDGDVKQCQPLGEDAVFQPLEGEERELQPSDGEVVDLQLPKDDDKPQPLGCKSTELQVSNSESKKLQSFDGNGQELKPLDDKTRDLGPLESKTQVDFESSDELEVTQKSECVHLEAHGGEMLQIDDAQESQMGISEDLHPAQRVEVAELANVTKGESSKEFQMESGKAAAFDDANTQSEMEVETKSENGLVHVENKSTSLANVDSLMPKITFGSFDGENLPSNYVPIFRVNLGTEISNSKFTNQTNVADENSRYNDRDASPARIKDLSSRSGAYFPGSDTNTKRTWDEVVNSEGISADVESASSLEGSSVDALDGHNASSELVKRPFYYLIRIPRYDDDKLKEQIRLAEVQVEEKTRLRDAVRVEYQKKKAACRELKANLIAARSEERAVRDLVRAKRQEIDSAQSVINRAKDAMTIEDVDSRIHNMERKIEHETLPLNEEKQLIREIKQLKHHREQLSVNTGKMLEFQKALGEKDKTEEQLKVLRKEMDALRDKLSIAEAVSKAANKKLEDDSASLNELNTQTRSADANQQEAYAHLQSVKKQLSEKNKYFWSYKDDAKVANDYSVAGDNETLECHCLNQVEKFMEMWNKNDEFRRDYIRSNTRSTLRRFKTLDGRSLGIDERPPSLGGVARECLNSSNKVNPEATVSSAERESLVKTEIAVDKPVKKVVQQNNLTAIARKSSKPIPSIDGFAEASRRIEVEKDKEEQKLSKEEVELARKAQELKREEEAAILKEQRRLEEKEKAQDALERKRRIAEKAQARAEFRAQKEAEQKEKEREKRAKKKERKWGVSAEKTTDITGTEAASQPEAPSDSIKEPENHTAAARRSRKPSQYTKQNKIKSILPAPAPLRNRGRRRMQQWMWVFVTVLTLLALFFLGNGNFSLIYRLLNFGSPH